MDIEKFQKNGHFVFPTLTATGAPRTYVRPATRRRPMTPLSAANSLKLRCAVGFGNPAYSEIALDHQALLFKLMRVKACGLGAFSFLGQRFLRRFVPPNWDGCIFFATT
jgi:hypothetical protein